MKQLEELYKKERWTVSDKDKIPIDFKRMFYDNMVHGARHHDERSLTDFYTVKNHCPGANYAFFIKSVFDEIICLDIEPSCSEKNRKRFLKMDWFYGERSLSGKGIHLFFDISGMNISDDILNRAVIKSDDSSYELLMNHFVTFTGDTIEKKESGESFEDFLKETEKNLKPIPKPGERIEYQPDYTPSPYETIIIDAVRSSVSFKKQPSDYKKGNTMENDLSKYEFAYIGHIFNKLKKVISMPVMKGDHEFTPSETAYMLYKIASDVIPFREKHNKTINGLPYLLYGSVSMVEKNLHDLK